MPSRGRRRQAASLAYLVPPEPEAFSRAMPLSASAAKIGLRRHGAMASAMGAAEEDGITVTYSYPRPVSLGPDGTVVLLAIDDVHLEAKVALFAVPRIDEAAFLVASVSNTTAEPLPAGRAELYRDGVFIGQAETGPVPAGGEAAIPFGAVDGIRLDWMLLAGESGDDEEHTLFSSRRATHYQEQAMQFSIEDLTGEPVEVTALYALPYSEQAELRVSVDTEPAPNVLDWENSRGVGAWTLSLDPGEKKIVYIEVEMSWPKAEKMELGPTLDWWP